MRTKITMLVNGKPRMKESEVTRMKMYTMPKKREEVDNTQVETEPQSQDEYDEDDQDRYL